MEDVGCPVDDMEKVDVFTFLGSKSERMEPWEGEQGDRVGIHGRVEDADGTRARDSVETPTRSGLTQAESRRHRPAHPRTIDVQIGWGSVSGGRNEPTRPSSSHTVNLSPQRGDVNKAAAMVNHRYPIKDQNRHLPHDQSHNHNLRWRRWRVMQRRSASASFPHSTSCPLSH